MPSIRRLLLTADFRFRLSWFKWLEAQAVHYEAIAISGDLLDVFSKAPLKRQVQRTTAWLRNLATKSSVILCSGNHDTIDVPLERMLGPMPVWLAQLDTALTLDGNTVVIQDQVILTSLSYIATEAQKRLVLAAAGGCKTRGGCLGWSYITIHHRCMKESVRKS